MRMHVYTHIFIHDVTHGHIFVSICICTYTYASIHIVHICVTVQYYSLYRSDACGCHPHEPTSLPQDFRVPLACHWL